jgi:two-component system, OmpR family, alkaline phosphatase synthesis response regulator PhoP
MKQKKILIIEDDADILKALKKRLEACQYEVAEASQGYEGLYRYLREKPDLIILDIMMPTLNGYEVCREIRREIKDEATPIIMLTAKGEDYDRIKGKVVGATAYQTKPFDWDHLLSIITECLG